MISVRGYFGVGLYRPRDPKNVGSALRACGCFGAAFLAYSGERYRPHEADTQRAYRHMPLLRAGNNPDEVLRLLPDECTPVAVELWPGAIPLASYQHPERAYYIFGPEDGSISAKAVERCAHVVRIPSRQCVNLAAAVNIVLYDRVAKHTCNQTVFDRGQRTHPNLTHEPHPTPQYPGTGAAKNQVITRNDY